MFRHLGNSQPDVVLVARVCYDLSMFLIVHRRIHVLKSGGSAGRGSGGRSPPEAEGFLSEEDQYFCAFC